MKVTTTLRDNGKVNQIVPIMQEHLGSVLSDTSDPSDPRGRGSNLANEGLRRKALTLPA